MDYEKKYNEALEKARIINSGKYVEIPAEDTVLEYIFPELAESEDERIREALVQYLTKSKEIERAGSLHGNFDEWIAWLEKQGKNPQGKSALEDINEEKIDKQNCIKPADFKAEHFYVSKVDGQIHDMTYNPTDKVEPKFRNRQWIVWQDKCYKVNYNGCGYELIDQNGLSTSLEYKTVDESAHLWDIVQDAKDGDILCSYYGNPFIYNGKHEGDFIGAYIGISNSKLVIAKEDCGWTYGYDTKPATKEQSDLLFSKMKEAGYTFDFEKKELKEIEQEDEEYNGDDYGIDSLYHAQRILEKTLGEVEGYQSDDGILEHKCAITAVKGLYKKKPAEWSEEDEKMIDLLIDIFEINYPEATYKCNQIGTTNMQGIYSSEIIKWLKQFKKRIKK